MKLNCVLNYSPRLEESKKVVDTYICSDHYIHIRMTDIIKPQVFRGFEKKLLYLISYLLHNGKDSEIINVEEALKRMVLVSKFKGIKILNNYKKTECVKIGDVALGVFPTINGQGLDFFCKSFALDDHIKSTTDSILSFLLDSRYWIEVKEVKKEKETKFDRKIKKRNLTTSESNFVELW